MSSFRERAREFSTHALFAIRNAHEGVTHNKLRAGLTSLGILFGVASVIAMLAIGRGAEQEILEQMRLLRTNNVIVTPIVEQKEEQAKDEGKQETKRYSPGLSREDERAVAQVVPGIDATSGEVVLNSMATREGRRRSAKLVGVDTSYFRLLNLHVADGSFFNPQQVSTAAPVAIIGKGLKARFFTTEDPIGRPIKVGDVWLTVIGVLEDRQVAHENADKLGIRDANMDVYVPLSTMLLRYRNRAQVTNRDVERAAAEGSDDGGNGGSGDEQQRTERKNIHQLDRLVIRVADASMVPQVADLVRRMLTRRHNQVVDFEVTVPELLLKQEQRTRTIFNVVLAAIAAISLIVGGIGIMNIMLASVLERIREIGVRRALGAKQSDVLGQFLAEAVMISLAGGIAGILTGVAISYAIEQAAGIRTLVSPLSVFVAFGVSIATGMLFGIVPAWRAAQQDPVVCLRYE
jgi:putative ABC transport system permease protein